MNDPKERAAWIKAQEAAADEDPHGYPEPGEPNESTEERMQRFFFQQMAEGNATANGDGAQLLTVTITLAEYRRLAQQDGKVEYLQEQLDKKEEALTFMHQKSIEDDKAASNYRRQIEDLNRDRRNLAENANIVANAEQKTRESLERANARMARMKLKVVSVSLIIRNNTVFSSPMVSGSISSSSISPRTSRMSNGAKRAPQLIRMEERVLPLASLYFLYCLTAKCWGLRRSSPSNI